MTREPCDRADCSAPVTQVVQYDGDDTERFCTGCFQSTILDRLSNLRVGGTCTVRRTATIHGRTYWLVT